MPTRELLIEFMTKTSETLGRIEGQQEEVKRDLDGVRIELTNACIKLPQIERGLNNHLATHDKLSKHYLYPLLVVLSVSTIVFLLKVIFHVKIF